MHDQKFGTFYSLRPEDGLYGSEWAQKMRNPPGKLSSNRAFQSFQVGYFIYIIDIITFINFPGRRKKLKNGHFWPTLHKSKLNFHVLAVDSQISY